MVILGKICLFGLAFFLGSIMVKSESEFDNDALYPLYRHAHVLTSSHHHAHVRLSPHRRRTRFTPSRNHHGPGHDVTSFGAVGDGKTDDSKAFVSAWNAACKTKSGDPRVTVPDGKTFLVSPAKFRGPCASPSITFEVLGSIVAPPRSKWNKKSAEWLHFDQVEGLNVVGNGRIDGKGDTWWKQVRAGPQPPTAMRFSGCKNLRVTGIHHTNSPRSHFSIVDCSNSIISKVKLTAPENSPNTDGIDISHSSHLQIRDSVIATGDDCVAINGGSSNVFISNVHCGPGHGISVGSLGKDGGHEEVHSVHVSNCTFDRTQNGARIKTWQGGSGVARNITFEDITFIQANNPVIIDQQYCPHKTCGQERSGSAVKISDVSYIRLRGTSMSKTATISFSCSRNAPCTNILLEHVNIKSRSTATAAGSSVKCSNVHGTARDCTSPAVNCLRKALD